MSKQDDQAFLNAELKNAVESGDEDEEKLVFLQYQQAMLQALRDFQPVCEQDTQKDMTLLQARVSRMLTTTETYIKVVGVISIETVKDIFSDTRTLLLEVADLCKDCQAALQASILVKFKELRQAPR